jgi:hypothetical protein
MLLLQDFRSSTWLRVYSFLWVRVELLPGCPHVSAPHLTFLYAAYITPLVWRYTGDFLFALQLTFTAL